MAPAEKIAAVIDLDALLAPIDGENPAGESLRYEGTYDKIKEARREDEVLEQGAWQKDLKVADWAEVIKLSTQALKTKTKDLQIAAWLVEGLVKYERNDRIAGLRDGLKLVRGLQEQFWENFYPEIDPEDDEGPLAPRANVVEAMEARLGVVLRDVPLTNGAGLKLSYNQWEQSKQFDVPENLDALDSEQAQRVAELKARAQAEGKVTSEDWRKSKNATPRDHVEQRLELLNECWDEFKALDELHNEKYQREAPAMRSLQKTLDDLKTVVERLAKEKRAAEPRADDAPQGDDAAEGDEAQSVGATNGAGGGVAIPAGAVKSRQEALRRLSEVAEFFRQTEPHSPVSYLVQRAVRWGQMPLEEWLAEVVKDGVALDHVRETLGIKSE
jgi:type VI secretion system protein ImpA